VKLLFLAGCLVVLLTTSLNAGQKVTLVTSEWPPYTSEKKPGYGLFSEIVSAAFKEAGLDVEYKFIPWLRCEAELREGKAFAAFPYTATDDRKKEFDFSVVLVNSSARFFYLKSRIKSDVKWEKYEDLKSYSIGGTLGYWYQKGFAEAGLKVDNSATDLLGLTKLRAGRFDLFATEELSAWESIRTNFPKEVDNFATVKKALNKDGLRLMISRTYPDGAAINNRVTKAIERIKQKGIYSDILKRYNVAK
jgi:polar amino acid transport system substrate-binding protein